MWKIELFAASIKSGWGTDQSRATAAEMATTVLGFG
jgi:hypothetical protein